ncbi:hypothetical protein BS50DRAFT_17218 [Corynespora cassiicola Philippines]|uniref:Uncharacterized protein n=1 Tax=Corynespora cassiicola Philippines TaxID=1448308 RepID=A0A2T2P9Z9_CORCC|nr:hypothetical protein BS50DRAFT_17218 [Corynespora cassiicola Philippines]
MRANQRLMCLTRTEDFVKSQFSLEGNRCPPGIHHKKRNYSLIIVERYVVLPKRPKRMCLTECPGQSISRRRCVEIEAGELSDMGAGRRKDFGALSIRECKGVVKLGYISTNAPTVVQTHHVRQVAKIGHRAIPSGWTWWRLWRRRWRVISRSFLG